jgi:hypothetical protein
MRESEMLWYIVYMTSMMVRDRPTDISVFDSSNFNVTIDIISKVIVGLYKYISKHGGLDTV